MFDKPQATHTLGLDIDADSLKGAALSFSRNRPSLETLFAFTLTAPPSSAIDDVKPLYTEKEKEQLAALAHKHLVVTTLLGQEVLVRPLELKIKKEKDIDDVLAFQAEPLLPYPIENALVDKMILFSNKEGVKLSLLAARKDHLDHHIKMWNLFDIEPESVSAAPAALALFARQFMPKEALIKEEADQEVPIYVLHLGLAQSVFILIENGNLVASQSINKGLNTLFQALAQDKAVSVDSARELFEEALLSEEALPSLQGSLETLRLDITRTAYALVKQSKGQEVKNILVAGEGACFNELMTLLCRPLNKTLFSPQPNSDFNVDVKELQKFAIPIGAALGALPKNKSQVNFRQQEFAYPAPWKRLKKPLALYLMLCFGIAIAMILFGKAYLTNQEGYVKKQYLELLHIMNKPYTVFEKDYSAKTGLNRDEGAVIPISSLTQEEMNSRLAFLEKELQSVPQLYPLQPNVPSVSDVLAWLSTHPKVTGGKSSTDKGKHSLQIESFSYTMLKRPELTKKQEKYQVKVELEFSTPLPKMAREFHDALIAPNDIVDPKGEIKWNSNRDKYRTSFYLKDKTIYTGA